MKILTIFRLETFCSSGMVVSLFVISFLATWGYYFFDELGRFDAICCAQLRTIVLWHFAILFLLPTACSYSICAFSAAKIHRLIQEHTRNGLTAAVEIRRKVVEGKWSSME